MGSGSFKQGNMNRALVIKVNNSAIIDLVSFNMVQLFLTIHPYLAVFGMIFLK